MPQKDEVRHVVGFRLRQFLMHQTLQLGVFLLGSPSDDDLYLNPSVRYQLTDELWAEVGGNVFWGKNVYTFYGQFEDDSHVYTTVRYAF
jgi:hypothetical protein